MSDKNQRINHLIGASLDKLDGLADVNTIIGKPIVTASGYQVIPFSKVTLGNLTGGGEYGRTGWFSFCGGKRRSCKHETYGIFGGRWDVLSHFADYG